MPPSASKSLVLLGTLLILSRCSPTWRRRRVRALAVGGTDLVITSGLTGFYTADRSFDVTVDVQAGGEAVEQRNDVTISISGGAAEPDVSGTFETDAEAGVATFADLAVRTVGSNYVLTAESDGLSPDSTEAFDITPGDPASARDCATNPAATGTADDTSGAVVTAYDACDNVATDDTVSVGLTRTGPVATLFSEQIP